MRNLLVSNGNIQKLLQCTQIYSCPQIQGICLCLEDLHFVKQWFPEARGESSFQTES